VITRRLLFFPHMGSNKSKTISQPVVEEKPQSPPKVEETTVSKKAGSDSNKLGWMLIVVCTVIVITVALVIANKFVQTKLTSARKHKRQEDQKAADKYLVDVSEEYRKLREQLGGGPTTTPTPRPVQTISNPVPYNGDKQTVATPPIVEQQPPNVEKPLIKKPNRPKKPIAKTPTVETKKDDKVTKTTTTVHQPKSELYKMTKKKNQSILTTMIPSDEIPQIMRVMETDQWVESGQLTEVQKKSETKGRVSVENIIDNIASVVSNKPSKPITQIPSSPVTQETLQTSLKEETEEKGPTLIQSQDQTYINGLIEKVKGKLIHDNAFLAFLLRMEAVEVNNDEVVFCDNSELLDQCYEFYENELSTNAKEPLYFGNTGANTPEPWMFEYLQVMRKKSTDEAAQDPNPIVIPDHKGPQLPHNLSHVLNAEGLAAAIQYEEEIEQLQQEVKSENGSQQEDNIVIESIDKQEDNIVIDIYKSNEIPKTHHIEEISKIQEISDDPDTIDFETVESIKIDILDDRLASEEIPLQRNITNT
jgi:hypothetical protein